MRKPIFLELLDSYPTWSNTVENKVGEWVISKMLRPRVKLAGESGARLTQKCLSQEKIIIQQVDVHDHLNGVIFPKESQRS